MYNMVCLFCQQPLALIRIAHQGIEKEIEKRLEEEK